MCCVVSANFFMTPTGCLLFNDLVKHRGGVFLLVEYRILDQLMRLPFMELFKCLSVTLITIPEYGSRNGLYAAGSIVTIHLSLFTIEENTQETEKSYDTSQVHKRKTFHPEVLSVSYNSITHTRKRSRIHVVNTKPYLSCSSKMLHTFLNVHVVHL